MSKKWHIAPLEGKYYGTEILDENNEHVCSIWNHYSGCFDDKTQTYTLSPREEVRLGRHQSTDTEWREFLKDYICDTHWECAQDYQRACLISAAQDLFDAICNSDDAHWTPAMRAAMKKAIGQS